jgi:replicative DNA helicase
MERKIIIGLITSTEFIEQIHDYIDLSLFETQPATLIASWCLEHYHKYNSAPNKHLESIFLTKKKKLPKITKEFIEDDILPSLNDEFVSEGVDVPYLVETTKTYFIERRLSIYSENIQNLLVKGEVNQAEKLAAEYKPIEIEKSENHTINLSNPEILSIVENAFTDSKEPIVKFPKQLGEFMNHQLISGGFVAVMASEKRGKSYFLLDMAVRAVRQRKNVIFFQAGDMTEKQQLRRIAMYLAHKSDMEKYIGDMYEPIRDCALNQLDLCSHFERACSFGIFNKTEHELKYEITFEELKEALENNEDYIPCNNCSNFKGGVFLKKINVSSILSQKEAQKHFEKFFIKFKRNFILSTYANGTLSLKVINQMLDDLKQKQKFIPDLIIIDYADLLVSDYISKEFRHQQDSIWKGLRRLSQRGDWLLVTATQADADSYSKNRLTLKNFSEDKRKYAHVTAMYGLNQDPLGREKKIGLLRINELLMREGDFDFNKEVFILQNLKRACPVLGSYF